MFLSVAGLMSACSPSNYPFFQPQSGYRHQITAVDPAAVPLVDTVPIPAKTQSEATTALQSPAVKAEAAPVVSHQAAAPVRHSRFRLRHELSRNPDVAQKPRAGFLAWTESVPYVEKKLSPAERKAFNRNRRVPTLSRVALVGSLLPYGILLFSLTSGFAWAAAMVFSLGSVLAGIAGLSKISRNPEKYRGKGWSVSAILLATGFMGIALLALAALSTSRVIWE